jgi:hypothetical protein
MTDFATLIRRAVERDLRQRFIDFLSKYEHVEIGHARPLTLDEAAMALACFDHFAADSSFIHLGVVEIARLRRLLNRVAVTPDVPREVIANACFDALACITALEARLCMTLDRVEVRIARFAGSTTSHANDA